MDPPSLPKAFARHFKGLTEADQRRKPGNAKESKQWTIKAPRFRPRNSHECRQGRTCRAQQGSMEGETRHPLLLVAIFLLLLATLAALLSSKPADDFESPPIGISQRTSAS
jgi:hypothetical protein